MIEMVDTVQDERERVRRLADSVPGMAIWVANGDVEAALVRLAAVRGLPASTALQAEQQLDAAGLITPDLRELLDAMRRVRNQAFYSTADGEPPSPSLAHRFLSSAFRLADQIRALEG